MSVSASIAMEVIRDIGGDDLRAASGRWHLFLICTLLAPEALIV